MTDRFQVGVIAGTHGVLGDVKIYPTTDDPKRFCRLKKVILNVHGREEIHEVSGVKLQDKFVILHLSGIDSPEQARTYRQLPLLIERADAMPLKEGRYYIPDLIGMKVTEEDGSLLGELTDVIETGANDVYEVVTPDGESILIPVIDECILHVDVARETMAVHLLPGLRGLQNH